MDITPLNKALFYLDLRSLLESGETATRSAYVALKQGPVVAHYPKRLVGSLEDDGIAIQSDEEDGSKPVSLLLDPPQPEYLNADQIRMAREIAVWAKNKGASWLSKFSHDNPGWRIAWDNGLGAEGPAKSIDMIIAMQQLADDDVWLSQKPTDTERSAIESADTEAGSGW